MTKIADIIDVPNEVHQGDFVLRLTEGVQDPEGTLSSYVVTPELRGCFDQSMSLVKTALEGHTSKGAYLHGSFGSGKSHFMAVLTLLLQGSADARSIPELANVIHKHNSWTQQKRVLVVPYHMIGARSMEAAVLGHYVTYIKRLHPDAPTPPVYRSEGLFEDARKLRANMGDEAFFANLGAEQGGDDGWGDFSGGWDPQSFDAAMEAEPGTDLRDRLITDLVDSYFGHAGDLAGDDAQGLVDLDRGLAVISRHARDLGYDGLVLFLDELILWLASHASDEAFINREGQKVAKLVESMEASRPIPIVSFIARQRDLRDLVSEHMGGNEQMRFADVLNWWEARFDKITLEDRNLPAIVEKRLLRPKSDDARKKLQEAFEQAANVREGVLQTLLTREYTKEQFRQVYPFSPVLVKALVALSALLQRERTALKLMLQLLVDQRDTLELGDIVPVGDLYDVLANGDEPFSQAMRIHFDNARRLYRNQFLPLLAEQYNTTAEALDNGELPAGQEKAFRADDRLVKTLLLAALADGVEELAAMTPARLATLNHGSVRSPIPGQEATAVLQKCRRWASQIGEIKISDEGTDATIALQLVGVDTDGILQNALNADTHGARSRLIKEMIGSDLDLKETDDMWRSPVLGFHWRGTPRQCEVKIIKVKDLVLEGFKPSEAPWSVVMSLPIGDAVSHDRAKVQQFQEAEGESPTLVWLPSAFSAKAQEEVGRLTVLEHVLIGQNLAAYGNHLSQAQRDQAKILLTNQRDQLRQRVRANLLTAYGISRVNEDAVDSDQDLDDHFIPLMSGIHLQPPVGANFKESLLHLMDQMLVAHYPEHPRFRIEVRVNVLRKVLNVVTRVAGLPEGRVEVPKEDREAMHGIAVPLRLGDMGETHFVLGDYWRDRFLRRLHNEDVQQLTVGRLRQWLESEQPMGLPTEVQNLVILTFAEQTNRRFHLHGGPVEGQLQRLDDQLELREQALPDQTDWNEALERVGHLFGEAIAPQLNATNVGALIDRLRHQAATNREAVGRLCEALDARLRSVDVDPESSDRRRSAQAAHVLVEQLAHEDDERLVETVAHAEVPTSTVALGASIGRASELADALEQSGLWDVLPRLRDLPAAWGQRVDEVLDQVREALIRDEQTVPLVGGLKQAQQNALEVLTQAATGGGSAPPEPKPEPDPPQPGFGQISRGTRRVSAQRLTEAFEALKTDLRDVSERAEVEVSWTIYDERGNDE
ncbi:MULTISPECIES: phage resistance protein [unclassified Halorhodospira]|uniref:phage resistance protein n=1 Tax=unclassified Halorhodospira TaxID=2626748 RepID=UPI001EE90A58|nr:MULTISPECIES: phage resistance protein [unclassified Halorhodospira]MCG5541818.1 phage resistance protein [Halorhodospira sp. M39old]MCG5546899.1 phage resistance protein [Halorhodospira sp. M38]